MAIIGSRTTHANNTAAPQFVLPIARMESIISISRGRVSHSHRHVLAVASPKIDCLAISETAQRNWTSRAIAGITLTGPQDVVARAAIDLDARGCAMKGEIENTASAVSNIVGLTVANAASYSVIPDFDATLGLRARRY
jgi:hypothetical protein